VRAPPDSTANESGTPGGDTSASPRRRLGLLGGTFDPVHLGHIAAASICRERLALDAVRLITARNPPHKRARARPSAAHRHAMVALAVAPFPRLEASDIELRRRGPSYTVDTLRAIRAREPRADLFFIVGSDTIAELPAWRRLDEIVRLATIVTVVRPGAPRRYRAAEFPALGAGDVARLNRFVVAMPPRAESSTDIRARIAAGKPFRHLVPADVADYIERHGLYR